MLCHPVDMFIHTSRRMVFLSCSQSGRQDRGKQPLYQLLSKLLLRLMERIKSQELSVECSLKTGTQQQRRETAVTR
jgi:hypothetical protein